MRPAAPTTCAIALSLALGACSHAAPEVATAAPAAEPAAAELSIPLRSPRAGLYTGGQPAPTDWAGVAALGVGTVINLRAPGETAGRDLAAEAAASGLRYHALPVAGAGDLSLENARALKQLLDDAGHPVLVHCASGNRVGALLALAAADSGEMAADAAIEFGRAAGLTGAEPRVREVLDLPASE